MPKKQKLSLKTLEVKSFITSSEEKEVKGGTDIPTIDIHTFNDYTCWWGGTCDTSRCNEGSVFTYCGTCGVCGSYCSECYSLRMCG